MTKKQLGASQVYVSPIILGTWSMGGDYFGETEDRAGETVIRTYLENGIDTFDTVEVYGNGRAETMLSRALEGVDCSSYTLISKAFPHHYAMADMEKACDDTLKRLKTDYLDTYFLHYPPKDMTIGQAMENIFTLKEKGKIRSIGVSNFTLDMLKKARNYADVDVVQPCYNPAVAIHRRGSAALLCAAGHWRDPLQHAGPGLAYRAFQKGYAHHRRTDGFFWMPAFRVPVRDTVGARDVFHGAFLEMLLKGMSPRECARRASGTSAIKCTFPGGRDGIPTEEILNHFLETGEILDETLCQRERFYERGIEYVRA